MRRLLEAGAALVALAFALPALADAEACQRLHLVDAASGRAIVGVEDLRPDPERGGVLLAAYDRRARPPAEGALYRLDPSALEARPSRLVLAPLRPEPVPEGGFRPHGFTVDAEGRIVVVNRRLTSDGQVVPSLDTLALASDRLQPLTSVAPPALCNPNAVLVQTDGAALVSNDRSACEPWRRRLDAWLGRSTGSVMRVTDAGAEALLTRLHFANGLAAADGTVWVAETRGRRLRALDGRTVDLPFAPDNLSVDTAGRLWTAGPRNLLAYAAFAAGLPGFDRSGSRVALVTDGEARLVLDDDGRLISGATAALATEGFLLVGAAYDTAIAYCRLATP